MEHAMDYRRALPPDVGTYEYESDIEPVVIIDSDKKPAKQEKDGKKAASVFVPNYDGRSLLKAAPLDGESETWGRVGIRRLPCSDAELAQLSKKYRQRVGGPMVEFARLSGDQQGVVNRLIEMKQLQESDEQAEWTLDCVFRRREPVRVKGVWTRTGLETKMITIIMRRRSRNSSAATANKSAGRFNIFAPGEIVDLAEPLVKDKGKKEDKAGKKDRENAEEILAGFDRHGGHRPIHHHLHDDPIVRVVQDPSNIRVPRATNDHQPAHGAQGFQQPLPPPSHHPPPGFRSVQQNILPPGTLPANFGSALQQNGPTNPFQPHPPFDTPDLYDNRLPPALMVDTQFQTRRQTPVSEVRHSRSLSRERQRLQEQEEAHRHETSLLLQQEQRLDQERRQQRANQRQTRRMLDEIQGNLQQQRDQMQELTGQFAELNQRRPRYGPSSDDSHYHDFLDKVDTWSIPSGASFTPLSSPGTRSPVSPSGTLDRKLYHEQNRKSYPVELRNSRRSRDSTFVLEPYATVPRGRELHRPAHRRDSGVADDFPRPPDPMTAAGQSRHSRPRVHQRAATYANDGYAPLPLALPQSPMQEAADFSNTHRRRAGREQIGRRRDSEIYEAPKSERIAYSYADDRGRQGGRRSDRALYNL